MARLQKYLISFSVSNPRKNLLFNLEQAAISLRFGWKNYNSTIIPKIDTSVDSFIV
ncbi:MAG: hypothetical protein IJQ39_03885 [Thermoguttaceae bacterium]|nr:hypothetical protein [Thermoguttaceae bacterium]